MKKSKLSAGIMTGLLAVGALAACSNNGPTYDSKGVILTYEVDGKKVEYTANDLFGQTIANPEHAEEMFNQVYKLVVRNYFTVENPDGPNTNTGSKQMKDIYATADKNVQIDKDTAKKNSKTNNTSEKSEFESILQSKGCENEKELREYYVFEEQQTKFKENFYKIYADEVNAKYGEDAGYNYLRDNSSKDTDSYAGYLETKVPYHVSHILVNVEDSASNHYWNGTISKDNVEHLKRVVDGLTDPTKSFGTVAFSESDDGSKENYGDLGIVDKDKATEESDKFVKEFILGLYTYDSIYNPDGNVKTRVADSTIKNGKFYFEEPNYIDYKFFDALDEVKEVEGKSWFASSANFYPRNIFYNHYLNNHGVSLISKEVDASVYNGLEFGEHEADSNFVKLNIPGHATGAYRLVLCARNTTNPVIVTRAGASYQGIHFIVANRSPFEGTVETGETDVARNRKVSGVKLSDYYTTKYPGQKGYPMDGETPLKTYVNTIDSLTSKYKERAEAVAEEIKTFDTNIERVIYKKYFEIDSSHKLVFTEEGKKIETTINDWIVRKDREKTNSTNDSWQEYWQEYYDMLAMQEESSSKKLGKGCAIAFSFASKAQTEVELDGIGGTGTPWSDAIEALYGTDSEELAVWNEWLSEFESSVANAIDASTYNKLFNQIGGACNDGEAHK